jgi:hypothetical protein
MTRNNRWIIAAAISVLLVQFAVNAAPKAGPHSTPTPNNARVTAPRMYVEQADTRHAGRLLWKMWARDVDVISPVQTVYATFRNVHAVLFNNGTPSATVDAPVVHADNEQFAINGSGRVLVKSLVQRGSWLKADTVTWYAHKNKGVATGNVVMFSAPSGMTVHTPRLYFDTALKTVQSSAGYGTLP